LANTKRLASYSLRILWRPQRRGRRVRDSERWATDLLQVLHEFDDLFSAQVVLLVSGGVLDPIGSAIVRSLVRVFEGRRAREGGRCSGGRGTEAKISCRVVMRTREGVGEGERGGGWSGGRLKELVRGGAIRLKEAMRKALLVREKRVVVVWRAVMKLTSRGTRCRERPIHHPLHYSYEW
jgi:hypothetical protein